MKIRIRTGDQKCYSLCKYIAKTGRILLGLVRVTDTVDLGSSLLSFFLFFSFFLLILARSNFDHYARECNFGILKKKQKQNKKTKQKTKKSFGCVFN